MKHTELFLCECDSPEHQFIVRYLSDDKEVYVDIHLTKAPFWQRVWYAIKYIFGYQCKYGAFDEIILNPDDSERLQKVVDCLRKCVVLPGFEDPGIPGKDFVPVDWVETLEQYGIWKIVKAKEEKEQKPLTAEEYRKTSDELYKNHPWYMQKPTDEHDLVAQLKEHLANTPKEQLEAEWKELAHVGPTVEEYLCSITPAEWSEEDDKMRNSILDKMISLDNAYGGDGVAYGGEIAWLKSLRPQSHWKPTEVHLSALLAVFNDPNNIGSQTCQLALTDLYEQLKSL